jgi:hypothetical protein
MNSIDARAPFLLLAHHRSGSNFFHDLLQSHPRIECINEPFSMHTRFFRQCDLVRWTDADYDPDVLHVSLAKHGGLRAYLMEMKSYLLQSGTERVFGFKETALFGKLEWLKRFMPSLKIIFLRRDPRAIVSSVLRSGLSDFWQYGNLVRKAFREIYPGYQSMVDASDVFACEAEMIAMSVVTRYELARRTLGLFEHRVLWLHDVMRDPAKCLRSTTDFLGIDPHPRQMSFLSERRVVSRGGTFSSFRASDDVENRWRHHLNAGQIDAIESVLFAAHFDGVSELWGQGLSVPWEDMRGAAKG